MHPARSAPSVLLLIPLIFVSLVLSHDSGLSRAPLKHPQPVICDSTGFFAVTVTPPAGSATWPGNSSGHTAIFAVKNTGACHDTYQMSYQVSGPITSVSLSPQ